MISRITKFLLILEVLVAARLIFLIQTHYATDLWLACTLGVGMVMLFRLLITANNFFITWIYHGQRPAEHRIGLFQTAQLILGEFKATMMASSWDMPFHSFSQRPAKNSTKVPVLLIHGYVCNSGPWHSMSQRFLDAGITHHAVDLEPILGAIDSYVAILERAIKTLREETGHDKVILVAHSMGGLASRAYLRKHGHQHIAKIITLGTPHHGTALANFAFGLNSTQMSRSGSDRKGASSDWLLKLAMEENHADYALFVSIYSYHDNIIAPQYSSHLDGARNIAVHGIGHVALMYDAAIQNLVIEEIGNT